MAKMGKVSSKAVKEEKEKRESWGNRPNFHKWKGGANFMRMMPPPDGMDIPWILSRRHFGLGPNGKGFTQCTETGKDCYACRQVKIKGQSKNKADRKLADRQKVGSANVFQMIDVTPLYSKKGKNKYVADNPPPDCWGNILVDEDGDPIKKCQRCSWAEACKEGISLGSLSGQRIDDVSDYFDDDTDITSLKEGFNIRVTKKGKTFGNTSYTIDCGDDYKWAVPKFMREVIKEKFQDIRQLIKPATAEETEAAYKGKTGGDEDLPECFGEFANKKKCKKCTYADVCQEEADLDEETAEEDDEEVEEKPKKKKKETMKPKKKASKDDEDDEDEEEEEDDDDEEADEGEEEEDDEEDEEDDEDADGEDDEESSADILESMDRKELKEFIKSNDLEVKVTKDMTEKKIRKAIMAALSDEDEEEDEEEEDRAKDIKKKLKDKAKKKNKG